MTDSRIQLRRIYDEPEKGEGARVLVDRVWPRGVSKDEAGLDHWFKELAPSTELRKWFGHDPKLWAAFKQKYRKELKDDDKQERLEELTELAASGPVILLFGARDTEHNQAVVLREIVEELLQSRQ